MGPSSDGRQKTPHFDAGSIQKHRKVSQVLFCNQKICCPEPDGPGDDDLVFRRHDDRHIPIIYTVCPKSHPGRYLLTSIRKEFWDILYNYLPIYTVNLVTIDEAMERVAPAAMTLIIRVQKQAGLEFFGFVIGRRGSLKPRKNNVSSCFDTIFV